MSMHTRSFPLSFVSFRIGVAVVFSALYYKIIFSGKPKPKTEPLQPLPVIAIAIPSLQSQQSV